MFKYRMSVVVPIYNCEQYIRTCLDSLLSQTMKKSEFEVLLIDDGSQDDSVDICRQYAKKSDVFKIFLLENRGVSSTRNFGIKHAQGQYIAYLDADDSLSPDALLTLSNFFDKHFDEVDLVTYKIIPYWGERRFGLHYRYRILNETGVYDLTDPKNCYIAQTTMNICVKNRGPGKNILFDSQLKYHEDQKYCFDILKDKLAIGYCSKPQYLYLRRPSSTTGTKSYAYYIFESTMGMWESLFAQYQDDLPAYLQSLYINDIRWKGSQDLLLPYNYPPDELKKASDRIVALVKRVEDSVILNQPSMDLYHKHYLLGLKGSDKIELRCDSDAVRLFSESQEIYKAEKIPAVLNRFKLFGSRLYVDAFLKCPVFMYCDKPELFMIKDGERSEIELVPSEHSYYRSGIKTAKFWRFCLDIDINSTKSFEFEARVGGNMYKLSYYFGAHIPFSQGKRLKIFSSNGKRFKEKDGVFTISSGYSLGGLLSRPVLCLYNIVHFAKINPRILFNRLLALTGRVRRGEVWLYLDRYGVFDNAYYQFKHDIKIRDGIKRYYILNECDAGSLETRFSPEERDSVVFFHSISHKRLYFNCDKIITSFSNLSNVSPFGAGPTRWYADLVRFELVYLQHGILHASLKNLYAKERCSIDRVVVSSGFEVENFTENYGYDERDLIKSCMPRYDFLEPSGQKKNRIVFSPSWRRNLIGPLINNNREEIPEVFVNSDFFREVSAFLNSEKLHALLEKYDLYLDFKNHPIFSCYNHLFEVKSDRVCLDGSDTRQDEYRLMITDYSSIVFDAVYLNCPVVYFVPDYDKFLAGVSHGYRKLDLPLTRGFGPFAGDAQELLDYIEQYALNDFAPAEPYRSRMEGFFLHKDNHCCDRLYDALING